MKNMKIRSIVLALATFGVLTSAGAAVSQKKGKRSWTCVPQVNPLSRKRPTHLTKFTFVVDSEGLVNGSVDTSDLGGPLYVDTLPRINRYSTFKIFSSEVTWSHIAVEFDSVDAREDTYSYSVKIGRHIKMAQVKESYTYVTPTGPEHGTAAGIFRCSESSPNPNPGATP